MRKCEVVEEDMYLNELDQTSQFRFHCASTIKENTVWEKSIKCRDFLNDLTYCGIIGEGTEKYGFDVSAILEFFPALSYRTIAVSTKDNDTAALFDRIEGVVPHILAAYGIPLVTARREGPTGKNYLFVQIKGRQSRPVEFSLVTGIFRLLAEGADVVDGLNKTAHLPEVDSDNAEALLWIRENINVFNKLTTSLRGLYKDMPAEVEPQTLMSFVHDSTGIISTTTVIKKTPDSIRYMAPTLGEGWGNEEVKKFKINFYEKAARIVANV